MSRILRKDEVGHCCTCIHRRKEPMQSWMCEECDHKTNGCFDGELDIAWFCDICDLYVPEKGYCWLYEPLDFD